MKRTIVLDIAYDISGDTDKFRNIFSGFEVINLQDDPDADISEAAYALVWKPSEGLFDRMPRLEVIFSVGAGVDHLSTAGALPNLPIVRFVDPSLTNRMSEWVCLQCLLHLRTQRIYDQRQRVRIWEQTTHCQAADIRVGVMGLGVLGLDAALKLSGLGFQVSGWSRTKKQVDGMATFDKAGLDAFLAQCDMLVGLLPLTAETTGVYNRALFKKLPPNTPLGGPVFINAGRGRSQVEADIIACLEDGTLGGVSLDVFETEPDRKSVV